MGTDDLKPIPEERISLKVSTQADNSNGFIKGLVTGASLPIISIIIGLVIGAVIGAVMGYMICHSVSEKNELRIESTLLKNESLNEQLEISNDESRIRLSETLIELGVSESKVKELTKGNNSLTYRLTQAIRTSVKTKQDFIPSPECKRGSIGTEGAGRFNEATRKDYDSRLEFQ